MYEFSLKTKEQAFVKFKNVVLSLNRYAAELDILLRGQAGVYFIRV